MDFSIVVPVFNAATYIERCLRALSSQAFPAKRYEILVVDNNSSDRSADIVRRNFNWVKLLHEPEQGSYAARNRGSREARGEVVVFTDPDCEPRADWLEQIHRAMFAPTMFEPTTFEPTTFEPTTLGPTTFSNSSTGVVLGERLFARDAGILGLLAAYESALGAHVFGARHLDCFYAYTNNMAVRSSILKKLHGFRHLKRGADSLFLRSAVAHYGPSVLKYAPQAVVRHLEIAMLGDYLRKKAVYGKVNANQELATSKALPLATRARLALQVLRERGGSPAARIGFLGVLAAGAARFEWERRRGGW
jgi:glycosyltransferase involved in cell wall biosynthesis